jgi:hypothetical protein
VLENRVLLFQEESIENDDININLKKNNFIAYEEVSNVIQENENETIQSQQKGLKEDIS